MRRSILPIAVALAAMTAVPAHAQQVVYDPTSFAQMVKGARTAIEQLDSLKAQVQQGEELFASLNDLSNVNAIAERLGLPEIRNPLPDMATLRSAADGDLSALGELAERADAIRRETRVYTPDAPSAAAEALERAGARTARDLAIGEGRRPVGDRSSRRPGDAPSRARHRAQRAGRDGPERPARGGTGPDSERTDPAAGPGPDPGRRSPSRGPAGAGADRRGTVGPHGRLPSGLSVKAALVLLGLLAGCGEPEAPRAEPRPDRAALEAAVEDCERGARRQGCDAAQARLAEVRRADRMAAYRQGF